jgi:GH25 family lysozyme M1 (1,4-beta-N-acetylmuramidase)
MSRIRLALQNGLGTAVLRGVSCLLLLSCCAINLFAQRPLGVDVSSYQGSAIDWAGLNRLGITFAWAKATEGLTIDDSTFTINEANGVTAGVYLGAYHYAHPELHPGAAGAAQEAQHFWSVAGNYVTGGGTFLMPMLDIEQDLSTASPPYTKATLSQWVNAWCSNVVSLAAAVGVSVTPVVYTYTSYATTWLDSSVTVWPLWMAQYPASPNPQTGAPSSTSPWSTWSIWQYSDSNSVPGAANGFDADVFNGTSNAFAALVIGGPASPSFTSQPLLSPAVDAGNSVSFFAHAIGDAPLVYQWTFNGRMIAGATNADLTLASALTSNSGNYSLIVTNNVGSITSSPVALLVYPPQATVFEDDFESNSAASWIVNRSSSDTAIAFSYDYSGLGIPPAPHSVGGTTLGLQMKANLTKGVVAALSISPTNQVFNGDYRLHFDAWINVNGPFPAGGASSTEFLIAGLGTAGNRTEWTGAGSTADGFYFTADGDGGVSASSTSFGDYSGYQGPAWQNAASGIYAAGSLDNGNVYYQNLFPDGPGAPLLQQQDYAQQTGNLNAGTFGLAWHDVIVSRRGSTLDWVVDGIRLATITNATFTASNICVGFWDPFASLTDNTNLSFGLVDNLRVEVPAIAPFVTDEPQSQIIGLGSNVTFTVAASGLPAPTFQWQLNGANLGGATNASLALSNVQATNTGVYTVLITNAAGSVISSNATLSLLPPAAAQFQVINVQPDGSIQITFHGDIQWTYTVQASTNLIDWNVLTNLTSATGNFSFTAGSITNGPEEFFRARVGP